MASWFRDTKDGDKIALLLLLTGVCLVLLGGGVTMAAILWVKEETRLDRAIIAFSGVGSQGTGLVTAAMGILRFQQKGTESNTSQKNPPTSGGVAP